MATHLQLGFTDYEQIHAKKRTRRQRFLDEMEATVPWEAFLALIEVSQALQQRRSSADSFGGDAADPPAAAVVHAFRSTDGGYADRLALLPPLRRDRDNGREDP
jgi:hypothetical protein